MNIYIIGAGVFGTALAQQLSYNSHNKVTLVCRRPEQATEINEQHTNSRYFPNKILHTAVKAISFDNGFNDADVLLLALPSGLISENIEAIKLNVQPDTLVVNLSKGIFKNGQTIVDFLQIELNRQNVVTLKGPTFAAEIINNEHSIFTLGFQTREQYQKIQEMVLSTNIHIDYTTDVRGVELLSALKNIFAISIGIVDAKYNSANTRFMLLTKAFYEIRILLKQLGGREDTLFLGCGFGDFGLTSLNDLSRNRTLGLLIGKGYYTKDLENSSVVLEGLKTIELISNTISAYIKQRTPLFSALESFFKNKETYFNFDFNKLMDRKMKTILTYGTFDLLHYGHVEILRRSKEMGDRLIVGLSTDEFNETKGKSCEITFEKRKQLLEAIGYVDLVIPESHWEQKSEDVLKHQVDIFVMGDDWKGKFDFLQEHCEVFYLPRTAGISTTKLKSILKEDDDAQ